MKKIITLIFTGISGFAFGQNVGIGNTSPESKLQVTATDSAVLVLENTKTLTTNQQVGLFFKTGPAGNSYYTGAIKNIGTGINSARIGFFTYGSHFNTDLVERMSILDNGNIGIGVTVPGSKLEINGQIKITGGNPVDGALLQTDANGLASWVDKSGNLLPTGVNGQTLRNNGTAWVANNNIFNNGNTVGIGTASPLAKLHISDTDSGIALFENTQTLAANVQAGTFYRTGAYFTGAIKTIGTTSGSARLSFFTGSTVAAGNLLERLSILNNGFVGIGTSSPTEALSVQTVSNFFGISHTDGTAKISTYIGTPSGGGGLGGWLGTKSNHPMYLYTNNGAPQATLSTNGNFGIATVSPTATLSVARGSGADGTAKFEGTSYNSYFNFGSDESTYINTGKSNSGLYLNASGNSNVSIAGGGGNVGVGTLLLSEISDKFYVRTGTNQNGISHSDGTNKITTYISSSAAQVGTTTNFPLAFFTNSNTPQMTLTTAGNVGIGTTAPLATLEVMRGTGVNGTAQFAGTSFSSHFNYSTSENTFIRGGLATSDVIINDLSSGNTRIAEGSGKVGIGTATPSSKLQVAGSFSLPIVTVTGDYTATANDYTIVVDKQNNGATIQNITLPSAASCPGRIYVIKMLNTNTSGTSGTNPNTVNIKTGTTLISSLYHNYDIWSNKDGQDVNVYRSATSRTMQSTGTSWVSISKTGDSYTVTYGSGGTFVTDPTVPFE